MAGRGRHAAWPRSTVGGGLQGACVWGHARLACGPMIPTDAAPDPNLRAQYEAAVAALAEAAARQLAAGTDEASVARWAVAQRNLVKQRFRALTPPAIVVAMEARTQARYGDPVGPTADALHAAGKSWADIIGSACRAGAGPAQWMITS